MKPARQRKLLMILLILSVLTAATALVLYALRQNISLFYSPTQVVLGEAPKQHVVRVGGMVVNGSVVRGQDLTVHFKITDYQNTVNVIYRGILPDLFREGQGVVALGEILGNGAFKATEVLAKHDEKYMPPEVKSALAASEKNI